MDEENAEKMAFITPWGMYYYKNDVVRLEEYRATYMRSMATIFHDMIHKKNDVYVDDVIIKSKKATNHTEDWRKFFNRF